MGAVVAVSRPAGQSSQLPHAAGAPGSGTHSVLVLSRCSSARRSASRCGRKPESRWQSWQMATARWPRWMHLDAVRPATRLRAWWWWSRRWAAAAVHAATSAAASPTGRCGFILSIADLFLQRPLTTTTPPRRPPSLAGQDWRRSCSALLCSTTVALATPSPERAAGPLPYARHRRRTHSKSPADGPAKRSAPRGAGELGRRTRAARATVRFLCVRVPRASGRCPRPWTDCRQTGRHQERRCRAALVMPLSDIGATSSRTSAARR